MVYKKYHWALDGQNVKRFEKYNFEQFSSSVIYCMTLPHSQRDDKWVKLYRNVPVTNCSP